MQSTGHNLNTVLLDAPEAIYILDNQGKILGCNNLATALFGVGRLAAGLKISAFLDAEERQDYDQVFNQRVAEKAELFSIEFKLKRDNVTYVIEQRTRLIYEQGLPIRLVASARDITEAVVNRKLFDRSEEKYRNIIQNSSLGLLEVDLNEIIQYANDAFCEITGFSQAELIGQNAIELLVPESAPEVAEKVIEVGEKRREGVADAYEIRIRCKDGSVRWVLISGAPVYDSFGKLIGSIGIHHDITVQKQEQILRENLLAELDFSHKRLQRKQENLRIIYDFASSLLNKNSVSEVFRHIAASLIGKLGFVDCIVYHFNPKTNALEGDPSFMRDVDGVDTGITPLISIPLGVGITGHSALNRKMEWVPDTALDARYIQDKKFINALNGDLIIDTNQLARRRCEIAVPIINDDELLGVIDTGHPDPDFFEEIHKDILETFANLAGVKIRQLTVSQSLVESESRTRSIIEYAHDAVLTMDLTGIIMEANQQASELFGYEDQELVGMSFISLLTAENHPRFEELIRNFSANSSIVSNGFNLEVQTIAKSGKQSIMELGITEVRIRGDAFVSVFARDVTTRKRAEYELKQALNREAELNNLKTRFINMASHEFRTPLTSIQSCADLLSMVLSFDEAKQKQKLETYVNRITNEVSRLTSLMNDILVIGRIESGKVQFNPEPTNLETFVRQFQSEISGLGFPGRNFKVLVSGTPVEFSADRQLLNHIMVNLISNAFKYSTTAKEPEVEIHYQSEKITLSVRDYGIGIPDAEKKNIFQSFFRASNVENIQGTGLGLVIVKQFVDAHGGTISLDSKENDGTRVSIEFKIKDESNTQL
jgi:PAS domain S-box-containing protein